MQVGEQLLRELVFIHLEQPSDKLQLVVQMLLKLYALVSAPDLPEPARELCRTRNLRLLSFHTNSISPVLLCRLTGSVARTTRMR